MTTNELTEEIFAGVVDSNYACTVLKTSKLTLRNLVRSGALPGRILSNGRMILSKHDIHNFLDLRVKIESKSVKEKTKAQRKYIAKRVKKKLKGVTCIKCHRACPCREEKFIRVIKDFMTLTNGVAPFGAREFYDKIENDDDFKKYGFGGK
jgi:hypothetical protein